MILPKTPTRGKWFFLCAFMFACSLFWYIPSTLYRFVVHLPDPTENGTIALSLLVLVLFAAGYLLPASNGPTDRATLPALNACGVFAFKMTALLFFPALLVAIKEYSSRSGVGYGMADPISGYSQALLYTHLFFGFMAIGSVMPEQQGWRRINMSAAAITIPRFLISLHGARFFVAQAVIPVLLVAIARGWIKVTVKRVLQFGALAVALIFVPAITRSDDVSGFGNQQGLTNFFAAGGSLQLFQDNQDLNLNGRCPPLLVSLTAKTIPYGLLDQCVLDIAGKQRMPATLFRVLTVDDPSSLGGTVSGTGSNFMLDLFLFGGMPGLCLGSAALGITCRRFVCWIGKPSLYAGIWAECLTRALFAPRNDLGYVYERIPSLLCATAIVVAAVWAWRLLQCSDGLKPARVA